MWADIWLQCFGVQELKPLQDNTCFFFFYLKNFFLGGLSAMSLLLKNQKNIRPKKNVALSRSEQVADEMSKET